MAPATCFATPICRLHLRDGRFAAFSIQDASESLAVSANLAPRKRAARSPLRQFSALPRSPEIGSCWCHSARCSFQERLSSRLADAGKCRNSRGHRLILLKASPGRLTAMPKLRDSRRWLSLNVTMASACLFTAASKPTRRPAASPSLLPKTTAPGSTIFLKDFCVLFPSAGAYFTYASSFQGLAVGPFARTQKIKKKSAPYGCTRRCNCLNKRALSAGRRSRNTPISPRFYPDFP